jgi:2-polyprenyl-3-methyl-5-hydroxy-6-metoxy-1,4-benzoquinol methylase
MAADLPLTGERTVPGLPEEAYWFARHEVVYRWVARHLREVRAAGGGVAGDGGAGDGGAAEFAGAVGDGGAAEFAGAAGGLAGDGGAGDGAAAEFAGAVGAGAAAEFAGAAGFGVRVVDAGCGEGYGADLLARSGAAVIALEYDEMVCHHAATTYGSIAVMRANLIALPIRPASVDAVVSLQVIEHLWDLRGFLRECRRVLRPGGRIAVSTPNRPVFSPGLARGARPVNPFHVEEFDAEQVAELLTEAGFAQVRVHGLEHAARLRAREVEHGSLVAAQVAAALGGQWDAELLDFVSGVTAADFDIRTSEHDIDGVTSATQDLLGVGVVA